MVRRVSEAMFRSAKVIIRYDSRTDRISENMDPLGFEEVLQPRFHQWQVLALDCLVCPIGDVHGNVEILEAGRVEAELVLVAANVVNPDAGVALGHNIAAADPAQERQSRVVGLGGKVEGIFGEVVELGRCGVGKAKGCNFRVKLFGYQSTILFVCRLR